MCEVLASQNSDAQVRLYVRMSVPSILLQKGMNALFLVTKLLFFSQKRQGDCTIFGKIQIFCVKPTILRVNNTSGKSFGKRQTARAGEMLKRKMADLDFAKIFRNFVVDS